MSTERRHVAECAYAGLPISERPSLPWPAAPGEDMCICGDYGQVGVVSRTVRTPVDRAEVIRARITRLEKEIERLEKLPPEPDSDPALIFFRKKFADNGREYDYAAIKAGDGLWYTTGPKSPKGYTWEQLLGFIYPDGTEPGDVELWYASELAEL